jgi:hypothetical protein
MFYFLWNKTFEFSSIFSGLKITGHGNSDNNLESHWIIGLKGGGSIIVLARRVTAQSPSTFIHG